VGLSSIYTRILSKRRVYLWNPLEISVSTTGQYGLKDTHFKSQKSDPSRFGSQDLDIRTWVSGPGRKHARPSSSSPSTIPDLARSFALSFSLSLRTWVSGPGSQDVGSAIERLTETQSNSVAKRRVGRTDGLRELIYKTSGCPWPKTTVKPLCEIQVPKLRSHILKITS
jgi:hypothetical protein